MKFKITLWILLTLALSASKIKAQTIRMDQNINTNGSAFSSSPQYLTEYNGKLYFQANDKEHGAELWVYDGSEAKMVEDFYPGTSSSKPTELYVANGKLYFNAFKQGSTYCLCEYDDTTGKIITIDFNGSSPSGFMLTEDGSTLFFSAWAGSDSEYQLCAYDFTNAPYAVDEDFGGLAAEYPFCITEYENKIFFCGYNQKYGFELFKYSLGSVYLADDIVEGTNYSFPTELIVFDDQLMFSGNTTSYGQELLRYGPKTAYFSTPIANINQGTEDANPCGMITFKGKLYFFATDGSNGTELWMYDGSNTPSMVYDINPGASGSIFSSLSSLSVVVFNNKLYFTASDGTNGTELWVYDGVNDPYMVADIKSGSESSFPAYLTVCDGKLYFQANDGEHGEELWVYDGTNSPEMVVDIYSRSSGSDINNIYKYKDILYFQADDGSLGSELWSYNGTGSASLLMDVNAGSGDSDVRNIIELKDTLYFMANDGSQNELYKYDGINTPQSTYDLYGGKRIRHFYYPVVFKDQLYYYDWGQLYTFNGYSSQSLIPTSSSPYTPYPEGFVVVGDVLYFIARYAGYKIWSYDGINNPVMYDKDFIPTELASFQNKLYFQANMMDGSSGAELWMYDGTGAPLMVYDIASGGTSSNPMNLFVFNSKLYFSATDGKNGTELWVYDGTNDPELVYDINPGTGSSSPDNFVEINGELVFSASDGSNGVELWRYDGVNEPQLLKNIYTGSESSSPSSFCELNNKLYFSATDYDEGNELWVYDSAATSNSIYVTVVDESSIPIKNVQITINNTVYSTNSSGQVEIIDVDDANYNYTASATGYDDANGSLTVAGSDLSITIALSLSFYDINFTVTNGSTVIENASILINGTTYSTDVNGKVTISGITKGTYSYTVSATGYSDALGSVTVSDEDINESVTLSVTTEIDNDLTATDFKIYPNPSNGTFYIEFIGDATITVYNYLGQLIIEREMTNILQLEINEKGSFLITLKNESYFVTKQVIIQ